MSKQVKTKKQNENFNNSQKRPVRQKQQMQVFTKRVDNFDDVAECIAGINGFIGQRIIDYFCEDGYDNISDIIKDMSPEDLYCQLQFFLADLYTYNVPDCYSRSNSFWTLRLTMDQAFLKTGNSFGIGWNIMRDEDTKEITGIDLTYKAYRPSYLKKEIQSLLDNDWTLVEE